MKTRSASGYSDFDAGRPRTSISNSTSWPSGGVRQRAALQVVEELDPLEEAALGDVLLERARGSRSGRRRVPRRVGGPAWSRTGSPRAGGQRATSSVDDRPFPTPPGPEITITTRSRRRSRHRSRVAVPALMRSPPPGRTRQQRRRRCGLGQRGQRRGSAVDRQARPDARRVSILRAPGSDSSTHRRRTAAQHRVALGRAAAPRPGGTARRRVRVGPRAGRRARPPPTPGPRWRRVRRVRPSWRPPQTAAAIGRRSGRGIVGRGDGPTDHQQVGAVGDRLLGRGGACLVVSAPPLAVGCPGTTRFSRGASSRAVWRSSAARTSPPQPPSTASRTRLGTMCGGASSSLVSTVTASAVGVGQPGALRALDAVRRRRHAACRRRRGRAASGTRRRARPSTTVERFTVVGMSNSLRSRKTW